MMLKPAGPAVSSPDCQPKTNGQVAGSIPATDGFQSPCGSFEPSGRNNLLSRRNVCKLIRNNPRTLISYFLISFATWADLLASYRVLIFQVPILDFAFVVMRFVCKLASRGLSLACVMNSSVEGEPP